LQMAPREVREAASKSATELLPSRPFWEPDGEHCQVPHMRFSFVPRKCLADMTLPPVQFRRSLSEPGFTNAAASTASGGKRNKRCTPGVAFHGHAGAGTTRMCAGMANPVLNKCHGDHCGAEICPPSSLQDLETSEHPWMRQARELCKRGIGGVDASNGQVSPLMNPDEIACCLQLPPQSGEPQRVLGKFGVAGDILASWIFEARAYPRLCRWLETEAHWMLDPKDPDQVAAAAVCLREDEGTSGGEPKFMATGVSQGLRNRLKTAPVCSTCLCIYNVIHSAVVSIKRQRGDKWASRHQHLRRERLEQSKREKLERELYSELRGDGLHFNATSAYPDTPSVLGDVMAQLIRDMSPRSELSASPNSPLVSPDSSLVSHMHPRRHRDRFATAP
jgi:hypothetical protein